VKSTPASFSITTVPGARIEPAITLAPPPVTRLSVAARRPGWSKTTAWPWSTSKRRQSMTARREVWRTAVYRAEATIRAAPRTTTPPSGPPAAAGTGLSASSEAPSQAAARACRRSAHRQRRIDRGMGKPG
jgi:hypothetical protein